MRWFVCSLMNWVYPRLYVCIWDHISCRYILRELWSRVSVLLTAYDNQTLPFTLHTWLVTWGIKECLWFFKHSQTFFMLITFLEIIVRKTSLCWERVNGYSGISTSLLPYRDSFLAFNKLYNNGNSPGLHINILSQTSSLFLESKILFKYLKAQGSTWTK